MTESAYNPLDKLNLARSIEIKLLSQPANALASVEHIKGAGVYVIYYTGSFPAYVSLSRDNVKKAFKTPIYVGKAIPKGGRKGGLTKDVSADSRALAERLRQHAVSIEEAVNLNLADFHVRHLIVDDIWIPLGENMLIETFKPVWNRAIDGFGNKDPGRRRATQYKSPWDVLHPGRKFAEKLADGGMTREFLVQRVLDYFAGRQLAKLPKEIVLQHSEEIREAEQATDDI